MQRRQGRKENLEILILNPDQLSFFAGFAIFARKFSLVPPAIMLKFVLTMAFLISTFSTVSAAPAYDQVRKSYSASDAVLLDRHGEVIHEMRIDLNGRKLEWTALTDLSPALVKAVLGSEDKRFREHHGVDWTAIAWAAIHNLWSGHKRGASTITMQLASLLDDGLRSGRGKRSFRLKWKQMRAAREIEKTWTKDQILEAYLNLVSFRGELQGISSASRGIFDKMPNGLDEAESAILAALIRSPNASWETVGRRAVSLSKRLGNSVNPEDIQKLALDRLSRPPLVRKRADLAPHVALTLLGNEATRVVSTLDARLQRFSIETLQQALGALARQNVHDGAVLVADNKTGDVLAYVGNAGSISSARYVDGVQARRQAGSTLKPFLYGLAIERKILTAASLIEDSPLDIPTGRGVYRPENYDREYRGMVTARTALASSLNIPAVKTLHLTGGERFVKKLRAFGFADLAAPEHYGPSLALGTADISLWELMNAYRTLANGGIRSRLRLSFSERSGAHANKRALSRAAAYIISDILSDREARSATFSLESPLATRYWTAVKTGTSKDMRDNWCVGYSERYTAGVWIGNFSGAPMWDVSGMSGAAPVWLAVMNYLHTDVSSKAPIRPGGVRVHTVVFQHRGKQYAKKELFLAGTEQDVIRHRSAEGTPRIVYPAAGTIIAVDPDIPHDLQKIFFESSSADPALRIVLNEMVLGSAPAVSWMPVRGKHRLSLTDTDGAVVDQITFEVK